MNSQYFNGTGCSQPHPERAKFRSLKFRLLISIVASLLAMAANSAFANTFCRVATDAGSGYEFNPVFGNLDFPRDKVHGMGSVLIAAKGFPSQPYKVRCQNSDSFPVDVTILWEVQEPAVGGFVNVYPTNIAGLGVRYNFGGSCNLNPVRSPVNQRMTVACHMNAKDDLTFEWGTSVDFVQTAVPVGSGNLSSIPKVKMFYSVNNVPGTNPLNDFYAGSASGTLHTLACQTPDVNVVLGDIPVSTFSALGSTSSPVKFKLLVNNCPAGMSTVKYRFSSPSTGTVESEGLIGLTSGSTAQGVKVILTTGDSKLVRLEEWLALSSYSSTVSGSYAVDLAAAYKRTGSVSGGKADAEVYFTMKYE